MFKNYIKYILSEFFDKNNNISYSSLITAQNPQNEKMDSAFNSSSNQALYEEIVSMGYENAVPTFYYNEIAYIIPNIPKKQLIDLGKKYNQKAVFWAYKKDEIFIWQIIIDGKVRAEKPSRNAFVCPKF